MNNLQGFSAKKIGNRIRVEMRRQHISVQKISDDIFLSRRGIYKILEGRGYPSLYSAVMIAEYLGISLDFLILGKL